MSTASDAAERVAEYVRQRDIAMSGGNVGDVITTVYGDTNAEPAHLNVEDLRILLAVDTAVRELHRAADPDGLGLVCAHCTALADCDVRWPCQTIRTFNGEAETPCPPHGAAALDHPEHGQASKEGTTRWQVILGR